MQRRLKLQCCTSRWKCSKRQKKLVMRESGGGVNTARSRPRQLVHTPRAASGFPTPPMEARNTLMLTLRTSGVQKSSALDGDSVTWQWFSLMDFVLVHTCCAERDHKHGCATSTADKAAVAQPAWRQASPHCYVSFLELRIVSWGNTLSWGNKKAPHNSLLLSQPTQLHSSISRVHEQAATALPLCVDRRQARPTTDTPGDLTLEVEQQGGRVVGQDRRRVARAWTRRSAFWNAGVLSVEKWKRCAWNGERTRGSGGKT